MKRYFIRKGDLSTKSIEVAALGDPTTEIDEEDNYEWKNYPYARMHLFHTPASETPNEFSSRGSQVDQPKELFQNTPANTEVYAAFAHSKMRSSIPIMAAYIHKQFGGDLTASEDLSEHSSKMVKHAKKLNLPIRSSADNPTSEVTNNYDFDDVALSTYRPNRFIEDSYKEIPAGEITAAKEHYRELRGYKKPAPKHMGPQFTQPQLPGMEK